MSDEDAQGRGEAIRCSSDELVELESTNVPVATHAPTSSSSNSSRSPIESEPKCDDRALRRVRPVPREIPEHIGRGTHVQHGRDEDAFAHSPLGQTHRLAPIDKDLARPATGETHHRCSSSPLERAVVHAHVDSAVRAVRASAHHAPTSNELTRTSWLQRGSPCGIHQSTQRSSGRKSTSPPPPRRRRTGVIEQLRRIQHESTTGDRPAPTWVRRRSRRTPWPGTSTRSSS